MTLPLLAGMLKQPEARLVAILTAGLGTDGTRGPVAQRRSIPADYFRTSARYRNVEGATSLIDPSYNVALFDRAVAIEWDSTGDERAGQNERDPSHLRNVRFRVTTGYLQGKAHKRYARVTAPETQDEAVEFAARRASEDAEVMRLALMCPELYAGDTAPLLIDVRREGEAVVESLGQGRLLCTGSYVAMVQIET